MLAMPGSGNISGQRTSHRRASRAGAPIEIVSKVILRHANLYPFIPEFLDSAFMNFVEMSRNRLRQTKPLFGFVVY